MENEEILEKLEVENESLDVGETTEEVSETIEESNNDGESGEIIETVSDADSGISEYDAQIDDIINELIYQREQMDSLQAYLEAKDMTIFEKPLEKYTVTEGLLLISFFVIVFMALMKLIGGIITCKV